jgi:hypothetical protein
MAIMPTVGVRLLEGRVMSDGVKTNTNSDRSDEDDEMHLDGAAAGQFEIGEYPPRVRWLQERDHHHLAKPAAPPVTATVKLKRARNEKTVTVLPVATRSSSSQQHVPRSGSRRKGAARSQREPRPGGGEGPSDTAAGMTSSDGDGLKRQRGSASDSDSEAVILWPVTVGLGGPMCLADEQLPANANTSVGIAAPCRGLIVLPPVTRRVSEAGPLEPGPRRSPRLRIGRER